MSQRPGRAIDRSGIVEEHHAAEIHKVLLVTVKQRGAGLVGDEFDLGPGLSVDRHDILDDTANAFGRGIATAGQRWPAVRRGYTAPSGAGADAADDRRRW